MKIKTAHKIKVFFLVAIGLLYCSCTSKPEYTLKESFESPNQKYILELHIQKNYEAPFSLSSESGYRKAMVILKDKNENILLKPGVFSQCEFILTDFMVDWQLEKGKVYFTKFNFINLKNKKFDCY